MLPRKRGYRRFAAAMAWDPGLTVYPRFRAANALNLLCLQAEVTALEEELNDAIDHDETSQDRKQRAYSHNFQALWEYGRDSMQWQLYMRLRATLKEYSESWPHTDDKSRTKPPNRMVAPGFLI